MTGLEVVCRRAENEDHKAISTLISKSGGPSQFRKNFGSYNVAQLIESGYLSVTVVNSNNHRQILGFLTLNDSPRNFAHGSEKWLSLFNMAPNSPTLKISNTLWVDFFVADESNLDNAELIHKNLFTTVFNTLSEIDYIVICPPSAEKNLSKNELFSDFTPDPLDLVMNSSVECSEFQESNVYICERENIIPTLNVREACVEDNEDLLPIFDAQSEVLSEQYGDFFLAEMIEVQDEKNKALVSLDKGDRACGLMGVSSDVELTMLQNCFHLEAFDYLVKLPQDESYDNLNNDGCSNYNDDEDDDELKGLDIMSVDDIPSHAPPKIIIAGAPASGKGTQCEMLVEKYGVVHLSTGDMLRAAVQEGSELGMKAKALMEAGELVPDDLIVTMITERLKQPDCESKGWLLDGFPRTRAQADALSAAQIVPHVFVVLDVPDEDIVERVTGRRLDPEEGKIYHVKFNPPADEKVAARLIQRADDTEEKCRIRLSTYHANVRDIVSCYDGTGGDVKQGTGESNEGGESKEAEASEGAEESKETEAEESKNDGDDDVDPPSLKQLSIGDEPLNVLRRVDGARDKNAVYADVSFAIDGSLKKIGDVNSNVNSIDTVESNNDTNTPKPNIEDVLAVSEPNAFAITLFCLDQEYESRSVDFLPHAFKLFKDRDYCILTIPSNSRETPLLKNFTAVPPKSGSTFSHVLYIMHKDALYAYTSNFLSVERMLSNKYDLSRLMRSMDRGTAKNLKAQIELSKEEEDVPLDENPNIVTFCVKVGGTLVGLSVVHRKNANIDQINWLRGNYHCEDFISFDRHRARNQATVSAFAISPTYASLARFVLREIMRLYDKTVLYHESGPNELIPSIIVNQFVAVRPRQRATPKPDEMLPMWKRVSGGEEEKTDGEEKKEGDAVGGSDGGQAAGEAPSPHTGMALHFITKRLLTEPKLNCNTRIVVVGGSTAGISFLENLLFVPYLNFTNVVLVNPTGLDNVDTNMLPVDEDYPSKGKMVCLGLENRIRLARCEMVEVDREAKAIVLSDDSILPYDSLVLATGRSDCSIKNIKGAADGVDGVFSLTNKESGVAVQNACRLVGGGDKIVVFGNSIEALTGIQGMLEMGISGKQITLVGEWDLGDAMLGDVVKASLEGAGVTVAEGRWSGEEVICDEDGVLTHLRCRREGEDEAADEEVLFDCRMLVCGDEYDCDGLTFDAVNDSGLVYDGRLVVDLRFKTVDDDIYAGGSLTKFSRKHKRQLKHDKYNSVETGAYLSKCVLQCVDPLSHGFEEPDEVPVFERPRCISGKLPGGYHYVRCSLPKVPKETNVMVTGGIGEGTINRYTIVKCDKQGVVVEFLYFGLDKIEAKNISTLVGLQEAYLNSCMSVYDKGLVTDWIEFFREDWASALYHDRFEELHASLRVMLKTDEGAFDVADMLLRNFDEGKDNESLVTMRKSAIGAGGCNLMPSTKKLIEANTLEFLRKNKGLLARFLLPERVAE